MSNIVASNKYVIDVDEIKCVTEKVYLEITFKDGSVREIYGPSYDLTDIIKKIRDALIPENTDDEG